MWPVQNPFNSLLKANDQGFKPSVIGAFSLVNKNVSTIKPMSRLPNNQSASFGDGNDDLAMKPTISDFIAGNIKTKLGPQDT